MKKKLSVILALCMLIMSLGAMSFAASEAAAYNDSGLLPCCISAMDSDGYVPFEIQSTGPPTDDVANGQSGWLGGGPAGPRCCSRGCNFGCRALLFFLSCNC